MKKIYKNIFLLITASCCMNFGQQYSENSTENPRINITGQITERNNSSFEAINILIGGLYTKIPLYSKPNSDQQKPEHSTTYIDLVNIEKISTNKGISKEFTFGQRNYIEVMVQLKNNQTTLPYLVEVTRKITCQTKDTPPLKKQISFDAIESIIISGYTSRIDNHENQGEEKDKHEKKTQEYNCKKASDTLREMSISEQCDDNNKKSSICSFIETLKNWIGGICGT